MVAATCFRCKEVKMIDLVMYIMFNILRTGAYRGCIYVLSCCHWFSLVW
jgi:hypothetical protein